MIIELASPTILAEDSRLQGELTFTSPVQIFGVVEGDIHQQSLDTLLIGESAWVRGSISAQGPVIISGRVEGNVFSKSKIQLLPGATITGTITSGQLEIRAGATINGEIIMRWGTEQRAATKHAA